MRRSIVVTVLLLAGCACPALAASFQRLGIGTMAGDMSGDGSTIVGAIQSAEGRQAYRWTPAEGIVGLGDLPGGIFFSGASDVSSDGSVIVGSSAVGPSDNYTQPFRWTQEEGMVPLPLPPGGPWYGFANLMSSDSSMIYGAVNDDRGWQKARWTESEGIVLMPEIDMSTVNVSSDGTVLVGWIEPVPFFDYEATLWSEETGVVSLGRLHGPSSWSRPSAVSADGSVVVGSSEGGDVTQEAFRWTAEGGMEGLGDFPGGEFASVAYGISADGTIIVGRGIIAGDSPRHNRAAIWDATHGMRDLQELLTNSYGLGDELEGWSLTAARGISDDHRVIWGTGYDPADQYDTWRAVVPEPSTAVLAVLAGITLLGYSRVRRRVGKG